MQLTLNFSNQLIFFCGWLALMEGIAQLVHRQRSKQNYVYAAFLLCIASYEIRLVLFITGFLDIFPWMSIFFTSSIYTTGPLLYYYYILFSKSPLKSGRIMWLHFVIPAMCFIAEIILFLLLPFDIQHYIVIGLHEHISDDMQRYIIIGLQDHISEPIIIAVRVYLLMAVLYIFCYESVVLKDLFSLYGFRKIKGIHLFVFFMFIAFSLISNLLYFVGMFIGDEDYLRIGVLIVCLAQIFMFVMSHRYPEFLDIVGKDINKKRYERTQLHNFDAEAVNNRLLELMEEDRLYNDENISLGYLSECLKITPHQLSEFLNSNHNVNFYTFITTYRIEEAKKLLLEDTDLTIIQIAFSVGFNSKSAFNSAFQKFTGTTPQNFRKFKNK